MELDKSMMKYISTGFSLRDASKLMLVALAGFTSSSISWGVIWTEGFWPKGLDLRKYFDVILLWKS